MKNSKINSLFMPILILFFIFGIAESVYCQPWRKPRSKYHNKIDPEYVKPEPPEEKDTVANRDFFIDLEKLSMLAIVEAAGSANGGNTNGSVILSIRVDTAGVLYSIGVLETSNYVLNPIAISALRKYFKRYNPKLPKKDGEIVEVYDFMIPIIFDMSIIEKNKQPTTPTTNNK
jgi:hypothetical protein